MEILEMVQTFHRTQQVIKLSGFKEPEFYAAIKDGRFPPPDTYLGPRSPVWTDETLANWQREKINAHKNKSTKRRQTAEQVPA
jgi:predicted DNA-binding transcriptional regulator AlpA